FSSSWKKTSPSAKRCSLVSPTFTPICSPILRASSGLAVPENNLKRLSSLRLRARLRSGTGLPSFVFDPSCDASFPAESFVALSGCFSSVANVTVPASISDYLQAGLLWLILGYKNVAGRLGFEPRQVPPKGTVLPLDDRPA